MKLNKTITLLRDENIDLREKIIDVETDYVILNESYKNFIAVSSVRQMLKCTVHLRSQSISHRERKKNENESLLVSPSITISVIVFFIPSSVGFSFVSLYMSYRGCKVILIVMCELNVL